MPVRIFVFGLLCTVWGFAAEDTTNAAFFAKLEQQLREDYIACTGDSTHHPVQYLIRWKRWVDSMIALPDFPLAQKAYKAQQGNASLSDRPCKVLQWKRSRDSAAAEDARRLALENAKKRDEAAESLAVAVEIATLKGRPDFLSGIPLGVSRRAFFWRAARSGFGSFSDRGSYLVCDSVPLCGRWWLGAFYFDTLGLCRVELEGAPRSADSLDNAVRAEALLLSRHFENVIGTPPHRINRVARDEITADELALLQAWSQSQWSVAVGLSRTGYRYYAKAVISNRPLPRQPR